MSKLTYRDGFIDGFVASAEGWNGEYPFDDDRADCEAALIEAGLIEPATPERTDTHDE